MRMGKTIVLIRWSLLNEVVIQNQVVDGVYLAHDVWLISNWGLASVAFDRSLQVPVSWVILVGPWSGWDWWLISSRELALRSEVVLEPWMVTSLRYIRLLLGADEWLYRIHWYQPFRLSYLSLHHGPSNFLILLLLIVNTDLDPIGTSICSPIKAFRWLQCFFIAALHLGNSILELAIFLNPQLKKIVGLLKLGLVLEADLIELLVEVHWVGLVDCLYLALMPQTLVTQLLVLYLVSLLLVVQHAFKLQELGSFDSVYLTQSLLELVFLLVNDFLGFFYKIKTVKT